jgi:cytochrome c553
MTRILMAVLGVVFCAVASGADATAGKIAYDKNCKTCHGIEGAGVPAMAKAFHTTMRTFCSAEVQALSDTALKNVMTKGTGKMVPVKNLSGADPDNLVAYIRTLKK